VLSLQKNALKKIALKILDCICIAICTVFGLGVVYVLLQIFFIASFSVPTESMVPVITPGDKVLVCKCLTGSRLFDYRDAADGKAVTVRRTPRFYKFQRNDILVFNFPHRASWSVIEMDWRVYYIKRCIGLPGDTVSINNFVYHVNSDELHFAPSPQQFKFCFPDDSVARSAMAGYLVDKGDTVNRWTIRDFGPLIVPQKGRTLSITRKNIRNYRMAIEWETHGKIAVKNDTILLNNKPITDYTFKEDYYFMAGDYAINSRDSRYWGFVPDPFIVGKAALIWWSGRRDGFCWKRI
jgi:signal peptidase I